MQYIFLKLIGISWKKMDNIVRELCEAGVNKNISRPIPCTRINFLVLDLLSTKVNPPGRNSDRTQVDKPHKDFVTTDVAFTKISQTSLRHCHKSSLVEVNQAILAW